jgi:hypothetical protein
VIFSGAAFVAAAHFFCLSEGYEQRRWGRRRGVKPGTGLWLASIVLALAAAAALSQVDAVKEASEDR